MGGGHQQANPVTGGKGKLLRGDKKKRAIFGRKGIDKEERERGALETPLDEEKEEVVLTDDEQNLLLSLKQHWAFSSDSAMSIKDLYSYRHIEEPEEVKRCYAQLNDKLRKLNCTWICEVEPYNVRETETLIHLNPDFKDDIISALNEYARTRKSSE